MELVRVLLTVIVFVLVYYSAVAALPQIWIVPDDRCDNIAGGAVCISIEDCTVLYKYILQENVSTDEARKTISRFICDRKLKKVCCPFKLPDTITSNLVINHMEHPNYKLLPEECGSASTADKIIGGDETEVFEFPWAVALKYETSTNPWQCGASLISERYVLTAAHCIRSNFKLTTVRLGEHNFDENPDCEIRGPNIKDCAKPPQDFEVSKDDAIVHPDYDEKTHENDIALIRLRKPADLSSESVHPICLPITVAEKTIEFLNYTVIGWGGTSTGAFSSILLKVIVPTVKNVDCASKYASLRQVSQNHLCAGGKDERDTCRGDSGSPLMAEYTLDGRFRTLQYGIVSLGASICGFEGYPTLYTRVAKYIGWILDNMKP